MPSSKPKLLAAAALSALALGGVAAQDASADSILYLKGGDVWLTTPDGSRQFQVTTSGGYTSASQAENGTIAALKGQRVEKLDRLGNVLAEFSTPVSDGTDDRDIPYVSHFVGPYDVDISPDGTKVAYNFHWKYWNLDGSTAYHYLRQGVGVSHADRLTAWSEPGLGYQTGWLEGSWYDDDTLLLASEANEGMTDVALDDLGTQTSDSRSWINANGFDDVWDAEVDRRHRRLALVVEKAGYGQMLWTYRMDAEAPAIPAVCQAYEGPTGGTFKTPTWSPDGSRVAWAEGDGIWVGGGQDTCGAQAPSPVKLVAGAAKPDWGPADVPASRPAPPAPPAPPAGGGGSHTTPGTSGTLKPAGSANATRGGGAGAAGDRAPAKRLTWSLRCRSACTITGRLVLPKAAAKRLGLGRTVATGRAKAARKGAVALTLKPTGAARAALARLTGTKATLQVTITERGRRRTATRSVTLP